MPVPDFDSLGNLPEAVYSCDKTALHDNFVVPFPRSLERIKIYDGFCRLHSKLEKLGINATQWIDGSFTTRKFDPYPPHEELEPGDIDVLTFMDYDELNQLSPSWQQTLFGMINGGETTKANFYSHTMALGCCAPGHPYFTTYEKYRQHYRDIFSRHSPPSTRKPNDLGTPYPTDDPRKGIIEIVIGAPALAPRINGIRY